MWLLQRRISLSWVLPVLPRAFKSSQCADPTSQLAQAILSMCAQSQLRINHSCFPDDAAGMIVVLGIGVNAARATISGNTLRERISHALAAKDIISKELSCMFYSFQDRVFSLRQNQISTAYSERPGCLIPCALGSWIGQVFCAHQAHSSKRAFPIVHRNHDSRPVFLLRIARAMDLRRFYPVRNAVTARSTRGIPDLIQNLSLLSHFGSPFGKVTANE